MVDVERLEKKKKTKDLIAALADDDRSIAKAAVEALGRIGDREAIDVLAAHAKDCGSDIRFAAARALIPLGYPEGTRRIAFAIPGSDDWGTTVMTNILTESISSDPRAILDASQDPSEIIRWAAYSLLEERASGGDDSDDLHDAFARAFDDESPRIRYRVGIKHVDLLETSSVASFIADALRSGERDARYAAVVQARRRQSVVDAELLETLQTALSDSEPDVRETAASTLGECVSVSSVPALTRGLEDPVPEVRAQAAWALGRIALECAESAQPLDPVLALLKDPHPSVRKEALGAIGPIGGADAVPHLRQALGDPDATIRAAAAMALGFRQDPSVIPDLERAATLDPDPSVRSKADFALEVLNRTGKAASQAGRLIAFLIEGPAGGIPGDERIVVAMASQADLEEKIAQQAHLPGAEVTIVNPPEWEPPTLNEISDTELLGKADAILARIMGYVTSRAVQIDPDDLARGGTEIRNPVSGKVFFVFRCR